MTHSLRRGLVFVAGCLALAAALPLLGRADDNAPAGRDEITNSIGMKLKLIKLGTFLMGSPKDEEGRYDNEGPQHKVEISRAFYLGAYPVTVGQFKAFVKDDGYQTEAEADGKGGFGYDAAKDGLVRRTQSTPGRTRAGSRRTPFRWWR